MKEQSGTRSADMDLGWVELNTATEDALANIPRIGRDLAGRLIEHRPHSFTNRDPDYSRTSVSIRVNAFAVWYLKYPKKLSIHARRNTS